MDLTIERSLFLWSSFTALSILRSLGLKELAEMIRVLLHFEYLQFVRSVSEHNYMLVLKDKFSGYLPLRPYAKVDADATAALSRVLCVFHCYFRTAF